MARTTFGGTAADLTVDESGGFVRVSAGRTVPVRLADGTPVTDLLIDGEPATALVADSSGYLPAFEGPDGVTDLYWEGRNGTLRRFSPPGPPGDPGPEGPQGEPGAPGGSDSATAGWVDDAGSQTRASLETRFGKTFYPTAPEFGAIGDGVADDSAALQACADAAAAARGIMRLEAPLGNSLFRNTGTLTINAPGSLRGSGSVLTDLTRSTIKLDGAGARVVFTGGRGGDHGGFNIDGNNSGDPTGVLKIATVQQEFRDITVTDAAGDGVWMDGAQNNFLHSVDVNQSGGDNWVLDLGSGGNLMARCELTSAGGWGVRITDSNPGGHAYGYQYGPADNMFLKCLVENYEAGGTGLILVEAGSRNTFNMCGISVNNVTLTGSEVVRITNDVFPTELATEVEFASCNLNGGNGQRYPIFHVQGTNVIASNRLVTSGAMFYQQSDAIYVTDGPTEGRLNADELTSSITTRFSATGAGAFAGWAFRRHTGLRFRMEEATGAWADSHPLDVARRTDAGARWWADRDGTQHWGNGADYTSQASIGRHANTTLSVVNQTLSGRKVEGQTDFTVPSASYAMTTDVSAGGPIYGATVTGSSSIASWALTNPLNLQQITLLVYRSAAQTVTWPTNVRFAGATAPPLAAGTRTYVTFQYLTVTGLWYEMHRAEDVPNT